MLAFNPFTGTLDVVSDPASTTRLGTVKLAGSLGGTALSPTLSSTISAGGPIGSSTTVPVITYNAEGRLTAVTTATISAGTQRTFAYWMAG